MLTSFVVVNFNVDNWQYIVTGYITNLETLRTALDFIKKDPKSYTDAGIHNLITETLATFPDPNQYFTLTQGAATIPLVSTPTYFIVACYRCVQWLI